MPVDTEKCKSCDGTGSYLDADDQVHVCPACREKSPSELAKRIAVDLLQGMGVACDMHRAAMKVHEHIAPLEAGNERMRSRPPERWETDLQRLMADVRKQADYDGAVGYPHGAALFREVYTKLEELRRNIRGMEDANLSDVARNERLASDNAALRQQVEKLEEAVWTLSEQKAAWLTSSMPDAAQPAAETKGGATPTGAVSPWNGQPGDGF